MSESISESRELLHQAERVGDHILNQLETNNSLISKNRDRFEAATIVAEFNGSERAFDIAWSVLEDVTEDHAIPSLYIKNFAEAAIKYHGEQGTDEAKQLATYIPKTDEDLTHARILALVVGSTDSEELKQSATEEAIVLINNIKGSRSNIFGDKATLLLQLGVANGREDLIDLAIDALEPSAMKFGFMELVAKALKNGGDAQNLRAALVKAAVKVQSSGSAFPITIVRYGFEGFLSESEMKELLGAVHRDGKQHLYTRKEALLDRPTDGVNVTNAPEMREFNKLASALDTWVSPQEHARFAVKALTTRLKEMWRQEGRYRTGSFDMAAYLSQKISEGIDKDPALQDPVVLDDVLEHGFLLEDDELKGPKGHLYGRWAFGLLAEISHSSFSQARASEIATIYALRHRLPYLSTARIELNAALAKSGDRTALADSAKALTHYPEGLLTRPTGRKERDVMERKPHLFPYKWSFFDLIKKGL